MMTNKQLSEYCFRIAEAYTEWKEEVAKDVLRQAARESALAMVEHVRAEARDCGCATRIEERIRAELERGDD